jgi:hypothetical protein
LLGSNNVWSKKGELLDKKVEELTTGSTLFVLVKCDYCIETSIEKPREKFKPYYQYINSRKYVKKDACLEHQQLKQRDVIKSKYGVDNLRQIPGVNEKIASKRRTPIEKIRRQFLEKNMKLLTAEYNNNQQQLEFVCLIHPEIGVQDISYGNFTHGNNGKGSGCFLCGKERTINAQIGDKSHFWKGGKTNLHVYLRERLTQWKKDSIDSYGGKCIITGEISGIKIHHIYPGMSTLNQTFFLRAKFR